MGLVSVVVLMGVAVVVGTEGSRSRKSQVWNGRQVRLGHRKDYYNGSERFHNTNRKQGHNEAFTTCAICIPGAYPLRVYVDNYIFQLVYEALRRDTAPHLQFA